MTKLGDILDLRTLDRYRHDGLISSRASDDGRRVYNYTNKAQWLGKWDTVLRLCRGLVVDGDNIVIGRPFPKFFNVSEHGAGTPLGPLPSEPFEVFDKLDGSLIVAYPYDGQVEVNSRGSFESDQAVAARAWLRFCHPDLAIPDGQTWCFEWVGPDNRVVVAYPANDLVLLAVFDTATGTDLALPDNETWPGSRAARYNFDSIEALAVAERDDAEGYVVRFVSGVRAKAKGARYVMMHRAVFGLTTRTVWESLATGSSLDPIIEVLPDEAHEWLRETIGGFTDRYRVIERCADIEFDRAVERSAGLGDPAGRKAFAAHAVTTPWPGVLFARLDGKDYRRMLWDLLYPPARPWSAAGEDT